MKLTATRFARLADEALGDVLAGYGFEPTEKEDLSGFYSRTYRSDKRYVRVTVSTQWQSEVPHCQAHLGEGPNTWPEADWNAIALWRLDGEPRHYPISSPEEVAEALQSIGRDFERHASDFFIGQMDRFRSALATQNKDREPYRIYSPDGDQT